LVTATTVVVFSTDSTAFVVANVEFSLSTSIPSTLTSSPLDDEKSRKMAKKESVKNELDILSGIFDE